MLLLLSGCFLLPRGDAPVGIAVAPPNPGCDDVAIPALYVEIQDAEGLDGTATQVEWRLANDDWQDAECGDEACTWWIAGYEVSGDMEVRGWLSGPVDGADHCEHTAFDELRVTIEDDGCHPITQEVGLVLDADAMECDTGA